MVGWAHSPFGRLDALDLEPLIAGVSREATRHAGIEAGEADGICVGQLNGGFVPDIFVSSLALQADDGRRWAPATRVENACASGAAALYGACDAIESGRTRVARVVGAEKTTGIAGPEITRVLGNASYVEEEASRGMSFPGIFAHRAQAYFDRYGDPSAALARIAAKNHAKGVRNPWAQMRKDLEFEFCNTVSDKNPVVAAPQRKTDCSLVSDGAAAVVLAGERDAARFERAVGLRLRAQVNDFLPMSRRDAVSFEGTQRAWAKALAAAGCRIDDLSFAEVHDSFTLAELLSYEAMGLARPGQGAHLLTDGTVAADGRLPVNASGGLKAKGHPIGATGVSMQVLAAMQRPGLAGEMQVPNARLGGVSNIGGSAVASYVSVLERVR